MKKYSFNIEEAEIKKFDEFAEQINKSFEALILENKKLKRQVKCLSINPIQCRCACRCLDNEFCNDAGKRIKEKDKRIEDLEEEKSSFEDVRETELKNFQELREQNEKNEQKLKQIEDIINAKNRVCPFEFESGYCTKECLNRVDFFDDYDKACEFQQIQQIIKDGE